MKIIEANYIEEEQLWIVRYQRMGFNCLPSIEVVKMDTYEHHDRVVLAPIKARVRQLTKGREDYELGRTETAQLAGVQARSRSKKVDSNRVMLLKAKMKARG